MNTKVAAGFVALAAVLAMLAGSAQAEVPEDGLYDFTNRTDAGVVQFDARIEKVGDYNGDGIYLLHTGDGKPAFLSAESANAGAKVDYAGPNETHWWLHKNKAGWSLHHKDNGANCLSTKGGYSLTRAQGTKDQLWEMKLK
ncbi:MAG: hypothetical protein R3C01_10885 [Planctomycetaceae bacterium]